MKRIKTDGLVGFLSCLAAGGRDARATRRVLAGGVETQAEVEGQYAVVPNVNAGEKVELKFRLKEYETVETAKGVSYQVHWKGSAVQRLSPSGSKVPLYANRARLLARPVPVTAPRYP
ncbi:MAG: hypothetical protein HY674_21020 [Chloroflexi bacterium]|nr:hypothetical protein [Chloroflexota bacterium]